MNAEPLEVTLDFGLPGELAVGAGTTIFVYGACWHPDAGTRQLEVEVDGRSERAEELGMPRRDIYIDGERELLRALDPEADWLPPYRLSPVAVREPTERTTSYRSGFWAFVDLAPVAEPTVAVVSLRAILSDGRPARAELGEMTLVPQLERDPADAPAAQARPASRSSRSAWRRTTPTSPSSRLRCDRFRHRPTRDGRASSATTTRVRSFSGRCRRWSATIRRFVLSRPPTAARFLSQLRARAGGSPVRGRIRRAIGPGRPLVSGQARDARRARSPATDWCSATCGSWTRTGRCSASTFFDHRPNNTTEIDRLLLMNTVTGAASLFRTELLDRILPFPPRIGPRAIHDQWIAAVALATGSVGYVDRPLHDYVQHRRSVLGHPTSYEKGIATGGSSGSARRSYGQRTIYFGDYCRLQIVARTLLARCGEEMAP